MCVIHQLSLHLKAESQMAALEKEMREKMEFAEKESARKAQEQADLQRMRDQAR